jgi:hypothetical protein
MLAIVKLSGFCLLSGIVTLLTPVTGQAQSTRKLSPAANAWPAVRKESKPWTRWWWMGSAVDKENISRLMQTYSDAGIGGVEIVPIYGAKGYESKYLPYLSPQWFTMVDHSVATARQLQMGVDIAVGTGWPIGGPQAALPDAASKLIVQQYSLKGGQSLSEKIVVNDARQRKLPVLQLQAVIAYSDKATLDITGYVDQSGQLNWVPPAGNWQLYAAFTGKTLQAVKRAAPGGEGYTLDHFSKTATQNYLRRTDSAYGPTAHGLRSFYNDSYEVYGADWTPDFFNEFRKRRGYDLKPFIRNLVVKDSSEQTARIKCDYRETMADLMLENFTQPFTSWAHHKKAITINQAHGSPGNLLDLYAGVDIAEAETFGSSYFPIPGLRRDSADVRNVDPDPNMLKFASSAAHTMGHNLASSETFTWLTEHFKTSFSQCKPEVEQVFLSGINHVFFHGTTYSPASAPWPGWLFYASVNFVPSNSLWPHMNGLTDYITRCQSVLQSGQPDNEILIYWPVFDAWQNAKGLDKPFKVHDIDDWLHPTPFYHCVTDLQQKGYSLDFVSDIMLQGTHQRNNRLTVQTGGATYRTLLVPKAQHMPVSTFDNILRLAREGATVLLQELPADVPGFHHTAEQRAVLQQHIASLSFVNKENGIREARSGAGRIIVCNDVPAALAYAGIQRETLTDCGLKFIRRTTATGKYYYLVNHTNRAIDTSIALNTVAQAALLMDPQTGVTGKASLTPGNKLTFVRVQLQPGEAMIIKTSAGALQAPAWAYIQTTAQPIVLTNPWQLRFEQGGPVLPAAQVLQQPVAWSSLPDTLAAAFSGTATYSSNFALTAAQKADDYLLEPGQVNESAKVWINGQYAGLLWSIPYRMRVGKYLKAGNNTITIEVANLMANRIRDMDRKGISWRNYHEINFVNINYKDFDASGWKVQTSGLTGPVQLVPVRVSK